MGGEQAQDDIKEEEEPVHSPIATESGGYFKSFRPNRAAPFLSQTFCIKPGRHLLQLSF
jgi:hypothetical protein